MMMLKIFVKQLFPADAQLYIDQVENTFGWKSNMLEKIQKKIINQEMMDDDHQTKRRLNQ